ncbi:unnamed protein product [Rotaria sordida]|uniref:Uncharacterized protein n=1 Tax=Rotaria sordida TaxID=392033 RepID=A0A818QP76_9BILA|nr:unnamed protein product [Rotaria sordida]
MIKKCLLEYLSTQIHELFRPYGNFLLVYIVNTGSQSIEMIKTTVADHSNLLKIKTKINVKAKKRRPFPHIFHVACSTTVASPTIY